MAKIISTLFMALDGVVEPGEDWHFPYFDDNMGAAVTEDYDAADTLLLGRVTYDSFAGAWPERETAGDVDATFAKQIGDMRKIVVSRERGRELGWRNAEWLEGGLLQAVAALKADPGTKGVLIPGSVSVVRQLLAAGALDELRLLVHPVAARRGVRLFDDGDTVYPFRVVRSDVYPTGVIRLIYVPAELPGSTQYDDVKERVPHADEEPQQG
jgi:dihydrofolate reductase